MASRPIPSAPGGFSPTVCRAATRFCYWPKARGPRQASRRSTRLYSSVITARVWVLNDLFIAPPARRKGVARALLCAAEAFARTDGALRLELETMPDNDTAQALYRGCGWQPYNATLRFRLPLGRS